MTTYDAVVVGTGGIGSAVFERLARRGLSVAGLDRFAAGHDQGSSHGQTRAIRLAYFEHPDYVPLLRRAFALWRELEEHCGKRIYHETGLLQIGPAAGEVISGVLASAAEHELDVQRLDARQIQQRHGAFHCPESMEGVWESTAGYLDVEDCVVANIELAVRHGGDYRPGVEVRGWATKGRGVVVETDGEQLHAKKLVLTAGPWAGQLVANLGIALRVLRKPQFWFACDDARFTSSAACPVFLYETPAGIYYGFPRIDGRRLKVAEHTLGDEIADPLAVDRQARAADELRVRQFLNEYVPGAAGPVVRHSVCMYTVSPDHHFIVDRHPDHDQVVLAAGMSGHGFKFAPVLGEALSDLVAEGRSELPIDFLGLQRFTR